MYLPLALLAYLLNSVAVLIDKFLLNKHFQNPLPYVFYISLFSLVALIGLPFVQVPSFVPFILASLSTLLWTTGAYFLYNALRFGNASRVIPLIGVFTPLFLLAYSSTTSTINNSQALAVGVLIAGLICLTFRDWRGSFSRKEFFSEVTSALFFAISYLVLKQAYNHEPFFTVLVWSRVILIPVLLLVYFLPFTQKFLKMNKKDGGVKQLPGIFFLFGQICGGVSELLLTFAISLAQPALVNSLQGSQYVFLFLMGLPLAKKFPQIFDQEKHKGTKIVGIALIGVGLYILAFIN